MPGHSDTTNLRVVVTRLERDPDFMAWALSVYRNGSRLSDLELARELVCDEGALVKLALCRMPHMSEDAQKIQSDVVAIAKYAGCSWQELLRVIRTSMSLSTLQKFSQSGDDTLLKAARSKRRGRDSSKGKRKKS